MAFYFIFFKYIVCLSTLCCNVCVLRRFPNPPSDESSSSELRVHSLYFQLHVNAVVDGMELSRILCIDFLLFTQGSLLIKREFLFRFPSQDSFFVFNRCRFCNRCRSVLLGRFKGCELVLMFLLRHDMRCKRRRSTRSCTKCSRK